MRKIAIANQKGGVGKSCTTVNLAVGLSAKVGDTVLVIDADPQANSGISLLGREIEEPTLYDVLREECRIQDAIVNAAPRLDVLPSNLDLTGAELELIGEVDGRTRLKAQLAAANLDYDWILIDCPPSLGLLCVNGLAAADGVIVVVAPSAFSLRGLQKLERTVTRVRDNLGCSQLEIIGVLLNLAEHTTISADTVSTLGERFGALTFKSTIPRSVAFERAIRMPPGSVFSSAPTSAAAEAFGQFIEELTHANQ